MTASTRRTSPATPRARSNQRSAADRDHCRRSPAAKSRLTPEICRVKPCTASPAGRTYSGGAMTTLTAMPTRAPTSASPTRANPNAPPPPTSSNSIAVIGASNRCGPSRNSRPTAIDAITTAPRLHQVRPTTLPTRTATSTPANTPPTRPSPCMRVWYSVSCTTNSAISGATIGWSLRCSTLASTYASITARPAFAVRTPGIRPGLFTASRLLSRSHLIAERIPPPVIGKGSVQWTSGAGFGLPRGPYVFDGGRSASRVFALRPGFHLSS